MQDQQLAYNLKTMSNRMNKYFDFISAPAATDRIEVYGVQHNVKFDGTNG